VKGEEKAKYPVIAQKRSTSDQFYFRHEGY